MLAIRLRTLSSRRCDAAVGEFILNSNNLPAEPIVDFDRSESDEPAKHRDVIEALAQELSCPLSEAKDAYESELARLKQTARVTDYLALFASRRAREALAGRQPSDRAAEKDRAVNGGRAPAESVSPRAGGSGRR